MKTLKRKPALMLSAMIIGLWMFSGSLLAETKVNENAIARSMIYDYFSTLNRKTDLDVGAQRGWLTNATNVDGLVQRGMNTEARSVGVQAGTMYAETIIKQYLESASSYLDDIFDVSPFLETHGHHLIFPAVVSEVDGRKSYSNNKMAFTYADKTYLIQKQPHFIDAPPNWRDYIRYHARPPQILSEKLLPNTSEEKKLWEKHFQEGWKSGIDTAVENVIFQLTRSLYDLQGIQLYTMLRDAGLISAPKIDENKLEVSGTARKLELYGGSVAISVVPVMIHDASQWKVIPDLPPLDSLLPKHFYTMLNRIE